MTLTPQSRPLPGVMRGVTHDMSGAPVIRPTKSTRVGIGIPKGKAVIVYIDGDRKKPESWLWKIRFGKWVEQKTGDPKFQMVEVFSSASRAETESWYYANRNDAADPGYPQKIMPPFFTFTVKSSFEVRAGGKVTVEELQEPDFSAIEAHGPKPKEIEIFFTSENPLLVNEFGMYSKTEKQCYGDGLIGMRILSMAKSPEEKKLAKEAQEAGQKYFPILAGCYQTGCPYVDNGCKPSQTLTFSLMGRPTIGVANFFSTTAYRSSTQIGSFIAELQQYAKSISWKPIRMVVAPFRSNHPDPKTGKPVSALQPAVHLEMREDDILALKKALRSGWDDDQPQRALTAATVTVEGGVEDVTGQTPSDFNGEFGVEFGVERDDEEAPVASDIPPAGVKSNEKVAALEEQLKAVKATTPPPSTPAPPAATATPAPAPATATPKAEALKPPEEKPGPVAVTDPKPADKPSPVAVPKGEVQPEPPGENGWPNRQTMNAALRDMKAKVGEPEFNRIMAEVKFIGSSQHTDAVAISFYHALDDKWCEMRGITKPLF